MSKQQKKSKWRIGKKAGLFLGVLSLSLGMISGCGGQTGTTAYKNQTIYGEVTEVKNQKVVIKVGTLKKNSKTELNLSEDTASFSINDSTVVKRNAMGGEPPEKPEKNGNDPAGEKADQNDNSSTEEKETDSTETKAEKEGNDSTQEKPEAPAGQKNDQEGKNPPPEKPDGDNDKKDNKAFDGKNDTVTKGDCISVKFDKNGNVSEITILSGSRPDGAGAPGERAGNDKK